MPRGHPSGTSLPPHQELGVKPESETVALYEQIRAGEADGSYAGMNISGVTRFSPAQKAALKALGAVEIVR